ncbi:hypothetical protein GOBAR_DD19757 [Gossypium barbadense]|nr:hypothetical protein GOBAR_DD19757 [Gossypium barbadense]
MELVDDEDVETIVALYCGNGSDKNAPIHLFAELAGIEQNEDVNAYGEEHGAQELWMMALKCWMRHILMHNNPGPHMSLIDPDAVYVAEFPEYPEIVHPHRLAVNSDHEELFIGQRFESKEECVLAIKRLATLMPRMGQQQVDQMEVRHVFVEDVRDAMVANHRMARSMNVKIYSRRLETFRVSDTIGRRPGIPHRSYGVDLRNKRCECRRFETLYYPCALVVVACAKVNLNVEQYVDDVYMLERTLRV